MRSLLGLGFTLALALALGCSTRSYQAGSESHFLPCERDADCGAFTCIDGVCREAPDASAAPPDAASAPQGGAGAGGSAPGDVPDAAAPDAAAPDAGPPAPCAFDTGFPGDDACLLPPAPDEGVQIHIGPARYDDPIEVARFTLDLGDEREECFSFLLPNAADAEYDEWEFSARPGLHHTVYTQYRIEVSDGQLDVCLDDYADAQQLFAGVMPAPQRPRVQRREAAPENAAIAYPLPARGPAQARMHHFNTTNSKVLRESWLNLYFPGKPASEQAGYAQLTAGVTLTMLPGEERATGFSCPISDPGQLLSLMSRTSRATLRVSAWLLRAGGERIHILESPTSDTPTLFDFDSVTRNPPLVSESAGAFSGILAFEPGDSLEWSCQIANFGNGPITHSNADGKGAVCDLVGATTGSDVLCLIP
jgi:hypothetical protein